MNTPHKCPICKGKGSVKKKRAQIGSEPYKDHPKWYMCHGCNSTGIIWHFTLLPADPQPVVPFVPFGGITWYNTSTINHKKITIEAPDDGSICSRCNKGTIVYPGVGCASCWHCEGNNECGNMGCSNVILRI